MKKLLFTIVLLAVAAAPRMALACSVCFGASDSPMAKATNLGIFAMLGVVVAMMAGFAAFFIHLSRRARMVGESHENEGTVRC